MVCLLLIKPFDQSPFSSAHVALWAPPVCSGRQRTPLAEMKSAEMLCAVCAAKYLRVPGNLLPPPPLLPLPLPHPALALAPALSALLLPGFVIKAGREVICANKTNIKSRTRRINRSRFHKTLRHISFLFFFFFFHIALANGAASGRPYNTSQSHVLQTFPSFSLGRLGAAALSS